tara:strand:- start:1156 stop:1314 length:159 start_codon:yes stop_codon:yes gene_type:complete
MIEYLSQPISIASALLGIAIWYFYNRSVEAKIKGLQLQIDQLRKSNVGEVND